MMEDIYDTNDSFDFTKLILTKPIPISGGNYFIKLLVNNNSLYIQPPKSQTKNGITKAGKKYYTDMMFTNENEHFIRWMENLENHCQEIIFKNREQWFEGSMELHDIENYFTSPLKLYKSGKYYIARINISTVLGKPTLKIYDEDENEIDMETINENMKIMTILEIQGIKCSARSFQIEIELKQLMVLKPTNLFEKCIIKPNSSTNSSTNASTNASTNNFIKIEESKEVSTYSDTINQPVLLNTLTPVDSIEPEYYETTNSENDIIIDTNVTIKEVNSEEEIINNITTENTKISNEFVDGMEEVIFHLEELPTTDIIQLKKRNDVYYEMYREARRKAKMAKNLALSSYLEAKRIKNTYMLNDIKDSDSDSDSYSDSDNNHNNLESHDEKVLNSNIVIENN